MFKLIKDFFLTVFRLIYICIMMVIHILIFFPILWGYQIISLFFLLFVFLVSSILPERLSDRFVDFCGLIADPFVKIFKKIFGNWGRGSVTQAFHLDHDDYN